MLETLHRIYDYSTERLRYAEGKNAALLAVNTLIFFRLNDSSLAKLFLHNTLYLIMLLLFSVSILICVISLMARLNIPKMMKKKKVISIDSNEKFDNVLSSLKMSVHTPQTYVTKLAEKLNKPDYEPLPLEVDYAEHIIVNSRIILFKFRCFQCATIATMAGVTCFILIKIL
jgi:hypothetical protein